VLDILCWLAGVHSNGPGRLIIFFFLWYCLSLMIALWMFWLKV
jgi:hypothetical protein